MSTENVVFKPSKVAKFLKYFGVLLSVVGVLFIVVVIPVCGKSADVIETYDSIKTIKVWDPTLIVSYIINAVYCWVFSLLCFAASIVTEAANVYLQKHDVYEVEEGENEQDVDPVEAYEETLK